MRGDPAGCPTQECGRARGGTLGIIRLERRTSRGRLTGAGKRGPELGADERGRGQGRGHTWEREWAGTWASRDMMQVMVTAGKHSASPTYPPTWPPSLPSPRSRNGRPPLRRPRSPEAPQPAQPSPPVSPLRLAPVEYGAHHPKLPLRHRHTGTLARLWRLP
jgi:hypothetical protein